MVADIDRFFTKSAAKLRDMGDRYVVQRPDHVLVEGGVILLKANFDAIGQKIILAYQVLFLHAVIEILVLLLQYKHKKEPD
jgi:hypothetical protein